MMNKKPANKLLADFSEDDLARVQAETFVQQIIYRHEVTSTNDLAIEIASQEGHRFPLLVLAENQTAGRGRRANRWWSARGALTFSLLLEAGASHLPTTRWPQASLTTGLAVGEALEELIAGTEIQLKWPNDVYVDRRKICGILLEAPRREPKILVLGIGINVNNSMSNAPDEISEMATAMCDVADRQFPLVDVLVGVLDKLEQRLQWIGTHDEQLRERWQRRCLLTGRKIQIETVSDRVVGVCQGIDEEGALVLKTAEGSQRCYAGTVTLLDD